jgi:hypothetical protein
MTTALLKIRLPRSQVRRFEEIRARLERPLAGGGGAAVAAVMRKGRGSVDAQFRAEAEFRFGGGRAPWKRTERFGSRPAPRKTLQRTGALKRAWTGEGAGSITRTRSHRVTIGVEKARFPQAPVFQRHGSTFIRADKMGKGGRSKMHWYLGLTYGVWIPDSKLRTTGVELVGRPVSINPQMLHRASSALEAWIIRGKRPGVRAAA